MLAPWPNRLGDGRYSFDGSSGQAPLDEPGRRNAIHGLVRWIPWQVRSRAQNVLVMGCALHPQPAYPWRLALEVEYRLGRGGLTVTATATNVGRRPAPFGIGFHPYLTVGTPTVDDVRLTLPAGRCLATDERGLPTGATLVAGTEFDFASGRLIGSTRLDTAFTALRRDDRGIARVELDDIRDGPWCLGVDGRAVPLRHGLHGRHGRAGGASAAVDRHRAHDVPPRCASLGDRSGPPRAGGLLARHLGHRTALTPSTSVPRRGPLER